MRCPGQDSQYWKADAIYDVPCPQCGEAVEFLKMIRPESVLPVKPDLLIQNLISAVLHIALMLRSVWRCRKNEKKNSR